MSNKKSKRRKQAKPNAADMSVDDALALAQQVHQAGRLDAAEKAYRHVLRQIPEHPYALNFLAILSYQKGNLNEAIGFLERAIAVQPDNADLYNNLGNLRNLLKQPEAAVEAYEKAIELNPKQADAHNNLGIIYRRQEQHDNAIASYQKAIALNPKLTDAFYNLGTLLASKGRLDEAIDAFRKALELDHGYVEAYTSLGSALFRIGRVEEAGNIYRKLLTSQPNHAIAQHMLSVCTGEGVAERASDDYVKTLFDRFADNFDEQLSSLKYRVPELIADAIADRFPFPAKQLDILDAGSGTGLCGPLLGRYARRLVGVDLSPQMLNKAQDRGYDELVVSELVAFMQKHPGAYDLIVSADTLIYFGALESAMLAAAEALRPDGLLVFTLEQDTADALPNGFAITHSGRYCHSSDYVRRCLDDAGLSVDAMHDVHLRLEFGKPVLGMLIIAKKLA